MEVPRLSFPRQGNASVSGTLLRRAPIFPRRKEAFSDETHEDQDHEHGFDLVEVLRVVFVALAAAAIWFHLWEPFHRIRVIGLAATLIGGYPIFKEALENIIQRRMTMELSMTIALVSALATSASGDGGSESANSSQRW